MVSTLSVCETSQCRVIPPSADHRGGVSCFPICARSGNEAKPNSEHAVPGSTPPHSLAAVLD
jgi:hypothetical protein